VRDSAAGNQIDATNGDDRGSLEVDLPGGFGNGASQAADLGQFTSPGVDPTRYRTVAVKSMQHFRAAFEPIARQVVLVDTGALCSAIYTPELFTKVRPPVWPRDPIPAPNAP
jgi:microcystin degradation protein MlrC